MGDWKIKFSLNAAGQAMCPDTGLLSPEKEAGFSMTCHYRAHMAELILKKYVLLIYLPTQIHFQFHTEVSYRPVSGGLSSSSLWPFPGDLVHRKPT